MSIPNKERAQILPHPAMPFKARLEKLRRPSRGNLERALELLNSRYVCGVVGNKFSVCDTAVQHKGVLPLHRSDFKERYRTYVYKDFSGKERSLGEIWLDWPDRRAFDGQLEFAPPGAPRNEDDDNFNTWRGFAVQPKPGDWSLFRNHLRDIVCHGNPEWFEYLLTYFAHMVQRPGELPGVSVVIYGEQGTGKTMTYETFRRLFHKFNRALLDNPKHVVGNFNMHLAEKILVCADEAVFARAPETVGKMKSLITQSEQHFESKGFDVVEMRNCVRLLILSNDNHVIHASRGERRFFVLKIKDTYAQQPNESLTDVNLRRARYFDAITTQLNNGGVEAMLHDLLHYDLRGRKLSKVPDTPWIYEQIFESLKPHQRWLYDLVMEEHPWFSDPSRLPPSKPEVYQHYCDRAKKYTGRSPLLGDSALGKLLRTVFGAGVGAHRPRRDGKQVPVYVFPPLAEAREKVLRHLGLSRGKITIRLRKRGAL